MNKYHLLPLLILGIILCLAPEMRGDEKAESAGPTTVSQKQNSDDPGSASPDDVVTEAESDETSGIAANNKWAALVASITILVLAVFVGFEIITKVPPTLHTPLMSGSNAISGISIVGALLASANGNSGFAAVLGLVALIMATTNVVGGYLVTHRMLSMFQSKR